MLIGELIYNTTISYKKIYIILTYTLYFKIFNFYFFKEIKTKVNDSINKNF